MTLWIFIGRLNPPHIWHIEILQKSLRENQKTLLLLWTPKSLDTNNPLDFSTRKSLIYTVFSKNDIIVEELKDNPSDEKWVENIIQIIKNAAPKIKVLHFYFWDLENDSAYRALQQYLHLFSEFDINFIEQSRKHSFVIENEQKLQISATNLRTALKNKDYDLAKKITKKEIFEKLKK